MKINIENSTLGDALKRVQGIVEKRGTIPILNNVLFEFGDGNVMRVTATDLDTQMTETIDAVSIEGTEGFTVPARMLYDIIRKLPKGSESELEVVEDKYSGRLKITSGRSSFELPILPSGDFPRMVNDGNSYSFTMAVEQMRRLISKTQFAISTEETRYYLNGIYFHQTDNKLTCVATDGHRLAKASMPLPDGADGMSGIIIPRKAVQEIKRLTDASPGSDMISISVTDSKITLEHHNAVLTSKLIDGSFPDYNRVVPGLSNSILKIDGKTLSGAIDRVSTVTREKARSMKMSLSSDEVNLDVNSAEWGQGNEAVSGQYSGDALDIGFNSKYMIEALGMLDGDSANMHFGDAKSPVLILDPSDQDCLFVIMPLRI